ncbi:MAG: hypothetical protein V4717_18855 [Bacteroidota bacterium]
MELDDLKQEWRQAGKVPMQKNQNIMELIQHKSNSPLASLRKSFRKQIIIMTVVPLAIIATNLQHIDKTFTSALFWFYIIFCICVILFARLNYNVVKKMQGMDGKVKSNLENQVNLLERRLKQNLIGIRVALLLFVILTEVLPYFQDFRMLNTWHSLSPFIRFGAYSALFLFQYFVSQRVSYQKFGRHIDHLKKLVAQMQ